MLQAADAHLKKSGKVLLDDVIAREMKDKKRVICENSPPLAERRNGPGTGLECCSAQFCCPTTINLQMDTDKR